MEELIVRAFIVPHRRSRWLSSLASAKRRSKFLDCLNHCADLDLRYAELVASNVDMVALLRSRGAPTTCYVVSDVAAIDGQVLPLAEAVAAAELAGWGTLISCVPGSLGCYIDEAGTRRRLLLMRTQDGPAAAPAP